MHSLRYYNEADTVETYGVEKNNKFVNGIIEKYQSDRMKNYYGPALIYHKHKKGIGDTIVKQSMNQLITKEFYTRMKYYEKRYYQYVTSQDNRKLIRTIEQIYNQPGEKRQLIHVFKKLGIVTKNQKEWREARQALKKYEEELIQLKKQIKYQEEYFLKIKNTEEKPASAKTITREVMENIKREIRMERLRYVLY